MDAEQERIEKLARQMSVEPRPALDERIQVQADATFDLFKQPTCPTWTQRTGRMIIKSRIVRVAAVIALITAIVSGLNLLSQTSNVVWALTDSIEVLRPFRAVAVEGDELDSETGQMKSMKAWSVESEDQSRIIKERHEVDGICILVANGSRTWRYNPQTHTVTKNLPYGMPEHGLGCRFLEQLQAGRESGFLTDWRETRDIDAATGKERIVLEVAWTNPRYNGPRSLHLEFDLESKLLVFLQQWENATWQGPARLTVNKITYHETLPEELFEMEIPKGATVIEH